MPADFVHSLVKIYRNAVCYMNARFHYEHVIRKFLVQFLNFTVSGTWICL